MLRTLVISLWACGVTAGTLFYFLNDTAENSVPDSAEHQVVKKPTYSEPIIVFVPMVLNTKITGYLFSNLVVRVDTKILEETTVPLKMLIQDSYLSYLVGNNEFALPQISTVDNQKLKTGLKKQINETVGVDLVEAVYASDINFLQFKNVRENSGLETLNLHEQAHKKVVPKKPKAKPKH